MKKLFLIIGAPGSGKTTDAQLIAQNSANISHYSTGDMLRAEVSMKSELGIEIEKYISNGLIVPIKIAIKTITNAIKNAPTDIIIIDGYPRSIEQLNALDDYINKNDSIKLISVIEIQVSEMIARERVLGRARGDDDSHEVFNNRMKIYLEPLKEIQQFYNSKNILKIINGEDTIDNIVSKMNNFINTKL